MASFVIKGNPPRARIRLAALPMENVVISVVTQAEPLYGVARKGKPAALSTLISAFLSRIKVLVWDCDVATAYGKLRASCTARVVSLGALDMMIAAHAVSVEATLVTHDKAFAMVPDGVLTLEDWIDS